MSRLLPHLVAGVLTAAMVVGFVTTVLSTSDPSSRPDVVRPHDNRRHRLGHLPHAETARMIRGLQQARTRAGDPRAKALYSLRLMDIYLGRRMHRRAAEYLRQAKKLAPGLPEVQAHDALLLYHQGRLVLARRMIRVVLARAPRNRDVQRIAKLLLARPRGDLSAP